MSCALIHRSLLLSRADRDYPTISPDGRLVAFVAPVEGTLNLWVQTRGATTPQPLTAQQQRDIEKYWWSPDSRYLLYLNAPRGRETWALFGVQVETGRVSKLTPDDLMQTSGVWLSWASPRQALVAARTARSSRHDLYRVLIDEPGRVEKVAENPGFHQWLVDRQLAPRGGLSLRDDGSVVLLLSEQAGRPWRDVLTIPAEDVVDLAVQGFDKSGTRLFVLTSSGGQTRRLIALNARTERLDVVFEDPEYDIDSGDIPFTDGVWFHPVTGEPEFLSLIPDRMRYIALTPHARRALDLLLESNQGDPFVTGRDQSNRWWIVGYVRPDAPIPYFLVDMQSGARTFLFFHRPSLQRYRLAPTEPFTFYASDGVKICGYLTRPLSSPWGPMPVVVLVHGGPCARNTWRFDPEVQWLANRGYVCLQINFRGSTGYGRRFRVAGYGEWGGRMQQDLYDGIRWAVEQGIVDPTRVAVMGHSYGGYAALYAACSWKNMIRCAVAISPLCDLEAFVQATPAYWRPLVGLVRRQICGTDRSLALRERSPAYRVENFRVPTLIAHGQNDPRVRIEEVDRFVEALRARGLEVEYLRFGNEGHIIRGAINRMLLYARIELFLARHLGGRHEELEPDVKGGSLEDLDHRALTTGPCSGAVPPSP